MKLTSRSHGDFARKIFKRLYQPLVAVAGLLTIHESGLAQDATTTTPAVAPPQTTISTDGSDIATAAVVPAPTRRNQVSFSGDYSIEQGKITLPIGYSLKASLQGFNPPAPIVATPTRNSDYYGGTISYSHGKAWFFDLSYAKGNSTGTQDLSFGTLGGASGAFTLKDDWYQAYVRYAFPKLRGKRLSAYFRLGGTYVDSNLKFDSTSPQAVLGLYDQTDKTTDIFGNVGLGATYAFYTHGRFSVGLQGELEAFGGVRNQSSLETIQTDLGLNPATANIDNTVYGGAGKGTVHFEYRLGSSGFCRIFLDGGAQYQYSLISYPGAGDKTETLWGPYVKIGLRYSF